MSDAFDVPTVSIAQSLLHDATQGGVRVAVVNEFIRYLTQQRVGIELEALLGTIPARIRKTKAHVRTVA